MKFLAFGNQKRMGEQHGHSQRDTQKIEAGSNAFVSVQHFAHVKTLTSQMRRALLTARKLLQGKAIAIENDIRGLLRNFGLKVGVVGTVKFEERTRELVEGMEGKKYIEIGNPELIRSALTRRFRSIRAAL